MDPLTDLLDAPRARGAFLLRVTMTAPWSVRVQDRAPLTVVAVTAGSPWYVPLGAEPIRLGVGDVLVIADPAPYVFADDPGREPQAIIHPGGRCETPSGASLELPLRQGVRTWGNSASGADVMLVGTYPRVGEVGSRVLTALPATLLLRAEDWHCPLVDVLAGEIQGEGVGQSSLLDRLLDALVVAAIREWASAQESRPPAWLRADTDPAVRQALELIHDRPSHPWTVASLADEVGLSRATLARRFTSTVGDAPMSYLGGWRLALAADLLDQPDTSVTQVAGRLGYGSPFTFSAAFKRRYGVSPQTYRRRQRVAS